MEHGPAQAGLLLEQHIVKLLFMGSEARADAGRATAHHHHIALVATLPVLAAGNVVHGLLALLGRLADQAHAAQLTSNEDARYVGFELGRQLGNVDATLFGTEHQLDRVDRAGRQAGAVSDAVGRIDQMGLAADDADGIFGAGGHARCSADAALQVDHRVQGRGFHHAAFLRFLPAALGFALPAFAVAQV